LVDLFEKDTLNSQDIKTILELEPKAIKSTNVGSPQCWDRFAVPTMATVL